MAGKKSKQAAKNKGAIKEKFTKTAILNTLSTDSGLSKKQVNSVLDGLTDLVERHLKKNGAGEFTLPGLLKIGVQKVPAKKARKGIDPFTKQERTFAAKPASVKIKVRALKKLKDAAL